MIVSDPPTPADEYLRRATEMEKRAATLTNPKLKAIFQYLARHYREMADLVQEDVAGFRCH
jgi:predicted adenine nucleotide alpha hydrolase (AANH) superfamily ATPase